VPKDRTERRGPKDKSAVAKEASHMPLPDNAQSSSSPEPQLVVSAVQSGRSRPRVPARRRLLPAGSSRLFVVTICVCLGFALLAGLTYGLRLEHVLVFAIVAGALGWSPASRRLLRGLFPFLLFGMAFDLSRLLRPLLVHVTVHVEEPYRLEQALFAWSTDAGLVTPNEYFAIHNAAWLDLVTGSAYILYLYLAVAFAAYLALFRNDELGQLLLHRYGWAFFVLNVMGIATYYLYPAAPPWYVAAKGLGPADLSTPPHAAAALRWDALTGLDYFSGFYARGASVFGAIPSLHAAYPMLMFLNVRLLRKRWLTVCSFGFFALVCFSAIYLQHHYIIDVVLGALYALAAHVLLSALAREQRS